MEFITPDEKAQLKQILSRDSRFQTVDERRNFLMFCGLEQYCNSVQLEKSLDNFVISLLATLPTVYITIDNYERLGLTIFLEFIIQIDSSLSSQERDFIQHVINKSKQWQESRARRFQSEQSSSPSFQALITSSQGLTKAETKQTSFHNYQEAYPRQDWGNAPDIPVLYGRDKEIATLKRWIVNDRYRLVAILGAGGIGKTSLVIRSIQEIVNELPDKFDYVIWRSVEGVMPISILLQELIEFLSNQHTTDLCNNVDENILLLIQYLRIERCLVILDNFNSVLGEGEYSGSYLEGYDAYGKLIRQVSELSHQSCLVLTSREQPREIQSLESLPVHSLKLQGLSQAAGQKFLTSISSLSASDNDWYKIINHYAGNPLALKIVVAGIRDFVSSNVTKFLENLSEGRYPFRDIDDLLKRQFERISNLEQEVMYWLAISRQPVSDGELRAKLLSFESNQNLVLTLENLQRRFLIEVTQTGNYTQQPVVMEYVTERFTQKISQEIKDNNVSLLNSHALIETTARDYVRETQIRLILKPLIAKVLDILSFQKNLENQVVEILLNLRETSLASGYAAGNILNLLIRLDGLLQKILYFVTFLT
ncbi:MAG: NACHT domain-containing protein [Scytonema sp. RU_4_4]|nr:NACHT domain-containing protein [Scytonema sp. RU_4_4]